VLVPTDSKILRVLPHCGRHRSPTHDCQHPPCVAHGPGGHVEEDTFWAVDKSYAITSSFFLSADLTLSMSVIRWKSSSLTCHQEWRMPSLTNTIFITSVTSWNFGSMEGTACVLDPDGFPVCSAISEAVRRLDRNDVPTKNTDFLRLQPQNLATDQDLSRLAESYFPEVGPYFDPVRSGTNSNPAHRAHNTRDPCLPPTHTFFP